MLLNICKVCHTAASVQPRSMDGNGNYIWKTRAATVLDLLRRIERVSKYKETSHDREHMV